LVNPQVRKSVRLIVYDFDGVLTDNRVWVTEDGKESVACNRSDGWWIQQIKKLGLEQVILSTEANPVVSMRGKKIGLEVIQNQPDKRKALAALLDAKKIAPENVCYLGNDMNDFECMKWVGFSIAPQDSHPKILEIATYAPPIGGGQGIARYVYDWLVTVP
jgi:3-deoxy-D-manno-octulosonate 8-phosphate phosphatase (KDO 8-P phosphatase)